MLIRRIRAMALMLCLAVAAHGANIAFFDNGAYTDPARESALLAASLTSLGHTLNTFSGIADTDWTAATTGVDLLVIPELDSGDLYPDLSPAARTALIAYVTGGGGLIMFDRTTSAPYTINMLNGLFGFSLSPGGIGSNQTLNAAAAAGTPFEGGPLSLPDSDATEGVTTASLPGGALSLYEDGANTSVFFTNVGLGRIAFLGFDWFADPTPAEWEEVLGRAVNATANGGAPIPEPTTWTLFGAGLAAIASLRRRRR